MKNGRQWAAVCNIISRRSEQFLCPLGSPAPPLHQHPCLAGRSVWIVAIVYVLSMEIAGNKENCIFASSMSVLEIYNNHMLLT